MEVIIEDINLQIMEEGIHLWIMEEKLFLILNKIDIFKEDLTIILRKVHNLLKLQLLNYLTPLNLLLFLDSKN